MQTLIPIRLKTRYSENLRLDAEREKRWRELITFVALMALIALALMMFTGCRSVAPIAHAAFSSSVALSEQYALEKHPELTPELREVSKRVCAIAETTNATPAGVVTVVDSASITNPLTRLWINGTLAFLNVAVAGAGTNSAEVKLYVLDLCQGMRGGLPPEGTALRATAPISTPHLK